jgi:ATP-binding cassette subfamily B protein
VIAHRLDTVQRCDDVLVLDAGRVVEHGRRERLAAEAGSRFAGLVRAGWRAGTLG